MSPRNREKEQGQHQGPSLLDEVLEHRILLYVLAAGATLAGAPAAQAKIVFTPSQAVVAYSVCNTNATLQIDLNNDGTNDFTLYGNTFCFSGSGISIFDSSLNVTGSVGSNVILGINTPTGRDAAALKRGAPIRSDANFSNKGLMELRTYAELAPSNYTFGSFLGITNRFLGVRFLINGETYYGWIGFRSTGEGNATLAGWAYETVPNTPILAGAGTKKRGEEPEVDSATLRAAEPTSLELLAAGHVAVADWRRRLTEDLQASTPLT
jgi:hypothetical protein